MLKRTYKTYFQHFKKLDENRNMPIPVVGKEGENTSSEVGFLNVDDTSPAGKALTQALGNLAKDKKAQIVVPTKQVTTVPGVGQKQTQTQTQTANTIKPMNTTGSTMQPTAMKESDIEEDKHSAIIRRLKKLVNYK
jgi:hypothetical protein